MVLSVIPMKSSQQTHILDLGHQNTPCLYFTSRNFDHCAGIQAKKLMISFLIFKTLREHSLSCASVASFLDLSCIVQHIHALLLPVSWHFERVMIGQASWCPSLTLQPVLLFRPSILCLLMFVQIQTISCPIEYALSVFQFTDKNMTTLQLIK